MKHDETPRMPIKWGHPQVKCHSLLRHQGTYTPHPISKIPVASIHNFLNFELKLQTLDIYSQKMKLFVVVAITFMAAHANAESDACKLRAAYEEAMENAQASCPPEEIFDKEDEDGEKVSKLNIYTTDRL